MASTQEQVFQIPRNCLANAARKALLRLPSQLGSDLAAVDGVAPVVAGTILHIRDQFTPGTRTQFVGTQFIEDVADRLHHRDIRHLVQPANVVGLARPALGQHCRYRGAVIAHVQPVAHVHPVAIHRQRLPMQRVQHHQRNQLLRKLQRTVVVGAIRGQGRQAVRVVVGAYQVIAACLRRRIRTVRTVRSVFVEPRIGRR